MKRIHTVDKNTRDNLDREVETESHLQEFNLKDEDRMLDLLRYCTGGNHLELGPCNMPTAKYVSEHFLDSKVYAVDISTKIVEIFGAKAPLVKYMVHDLNEDFPFPDEFFDSISAGEIIEHVNDPQHFMNECKRVLKPGRWLAISTPHKETDKGDHGGEWHQWSWDNGDMDKLWGSPCEEKIIAYKALKSLVVWCQKI